MVRLILIIFLIANLAACLPGDSAFSVQGKVVDTNRIPFDSCKMTLYIEGNNTSDDISDISSDFLSTFVVSPRKQNYFVTISCDGSQDKYKSELIEIGTEDKLTNPVDLGVIKLDRKT